MRLYVHAQFAHCFEMFSETEWEIIIYVFRQDHEVIANPEHQWLARRRANTWVLMQAEADNESLSVVVSFTSDTRLPLSQLLLQWTASQNRRISFETTTTDAVNTPFTQQSFSVSERWHVNDHFCPILSTFSCSLDVFVIIQFVFLGIQFCFYWAYMHSITTTRLLTVRRLCYTLKGWKS